MSGPRGFHHSVADNQAHYTGSRMLRYEGGRGGMEAKVNAALGALEVGVKSVVLASGSEKEVLQRRGRGVFFIIHHRHAIDAICLTQGPRRRRRRHLLQQRHRAEAFARRR